MHTQLAAVSWSVEPCLERICQTAGQLVVIQSNVLSDPLLHVSKSLQLSGIVNSLCSCSAVCQACQYSFCLSKLQSCLGAGTMSGARTKLSTAVRPFGQPKTMPLVVHTGGNTLYEEPCLAYLHLHITKVPHPVLTVCI